MTCSSCGRSNPADACFCVACGTALAEEEITARFDREELASWTVPPLRTRPLLRIGARTDLGKVRENNEDRFDFFEPDDPSVRASRGSLFMVCDGVGGHAAGQIASELACKTFLAEYYNGMPRSPQDAGLAAALVANRYIFDVSQSVRSRAGMGTTLTALALCQDNAFIFHLGDSRCYRLRNGKLEQLTDDHTWVAEQIRLGAMSAEDAHSSPYAHMIVRACGIEKSVEADALTHPLERGDTFLLCSDGLTNHVSDTRIAEALASFGPSAACLHLVQAALDDGGSDNCTVVIVRVEELLKVGMQPMPPIDTTQVLRNFFSSS